MKAVAHKALFRALSKRPAGKIALVRCSYCWQMHHVCWGHCPSCGPSPTEGPRYSEELPELPVEPDIEAPLPVAELPNDLYRDWSHDTGEDGLDREEMRR